MFASVLLQTVDTFGCLFFLNDSFIHSSNPERIIVSRGSCTLVPLDDVGVGAVIVVIGCAAAVVCLQLQLTRQ